MNKGEQDTAELGANTDANHTCTKISLTFFLPDIFLLDAYKKNKKDPTPVKSLFENTMGNPFFYFF